LILSSICRISQTYLDLLFSPRTLAFMDAHQPKRQYNRCVWKPPTVLLDSSDNI
jgi:hypothetical protein